MLLSRQAVSGCRPSMQHTTRSKPAPVLSRPEHNLRHLAVSKPHVRTMRLQAAEDGLMSNLDQAKTEEMMKRFDMADENKNGVIDKSELRGLLQSTGDSSLVKFTQHWLPDEELDKVMEKYDKDKNGIIDREEYLQIVYDGLLLDGQLTDYENAFNAVDVSGNGTIGATELAKLFSLIGNPQSFEKLVGIMQEYDIDESGQIEFSEFLMIFRNNLLELKDIQKFMGSVPSGEDSKKLLAAAEGDMNLIFSEKELDEAISDAKTNNKVVVVFSALTWCRPCKGMQRPAHKLAEQYKDSTVWIKLFGNANSGTKSLFRDRLKIKSTPCFIVLKDGEMAYTQSGTNKEKLEAGLRETIAGHPSLPADLIYPQAVAA